MRAMQLRAAVAFALGAVGANAFYLPGAAPKDYLPGDPVPLLVNSLTPQTSVDAQLNSLLSYDYYDERFGFCKPAKGPKSQSETLGSVLFGDRLYDSPFQVNMLENVTCQHLCTSTLPEGSSDFLAARIKDSYALNWLVDGLPAAEMKPDQRTGEVFYSMGFGLGMARPTKEEPENDEDWSVTVNNHFNIYIEYHSPDGIHNRVVGVVVWPKSVDSLAHGTTSPRCDSQEVKEVRHGRSNQIAYTYSIQWWESPTPWATRWDHYLKIFDPRIHVFSLINSIIVAMFLCLMVAAILMRTVKRDINRYNTIDLADEVQEEFGWKLVHGEVFRPPRKRMFLSVAVGSGLQLAAMSVVTLVFALLGFLSPSNRGSLSTVMIVCWTLFGFIAGYVSSRTFLSLKGEELRKNTAITALLFPTFLFTALFLLNLFLVGAGSSGAVPFGTFLAIVALWTLINAPLTVAGAYLGARKGGLDNPVRVNQIPRQIPPLPTYLKPLPSALIAGALPFGAASLELYFVLQNLFGSKAYYAFGFLAITFVIVALTAATTSVLMCYFHLCAEDFRWHWRAFLAGGGSAFWLLGYGLVYWMTRLHLVGFSNKILYLSYLLLICLLDFLVFGAIGFLAVFFFLRHIYSQVRVD